MKINLSENEAAIFRAIAEAGEKTGTKVWLIGGFVRDKLIGRETKDADIVCLGDGIGLAKAVAELQRPKPHVSFFKKFWNCTYQGGKL